MISLGFAMPAGSTIPASVRLEFAQQLEKLGYGSFWLPHFISRDVDGYDALDMLAAVAGRTSTIDLGTDVLQVPLYHPVDLARRVVTLDHISGGRFILGVGIGFIPLEFGNLGVPFQERGARMDEALELLVRLWTEEEVTYEGKFYRVKDAVLAPKPLQKPYPRLLMGGLHSGIQRGAPGALRKGGWNRPGIQRTVRWATGWIPGGRPDLEVCRQGMALLKEAASSAGRSIDEETFDLTLSSFGQFNIDSDRDRAVREAERFYNTRLRKGFYQVQANPSFESLRESGCYGTAAEAAKVINHWRGFKATVPALKRIVIMFASLDPLRQLDRFHEEVRPLLTST
jgi:alkanesulfonate monooxygenase SsuD/methylene tetrahydromethanopterin reductase-like flavin-dependent oxidoreductase (luciferase family)